MHVLIITEVTHVHVHELHALDFFTSFLAGSVRKQYERSILVHGHNLALMVTLSVSY